jgi:hypothetical protein
MILLFPVINKTVMGETQGQEGVGPENRDLFGPNKFLIFKAHPFQWRPKWICPHQNHYVRRHINNRYINSYLFSLHRSSSRLASQKPEGSSIFLCLVSHFCLSYFVLIFPGVNHRVHTEWRLPISGVHPIMMEKPALAGEGGGARPPPFSLLPSSKKLQ